MPEAGLRVTSDQLIALNDEIATLVRAGVPLELGLRELRGSVPSALSRISARIAKNLNEGQPLPQSLSAAIPGLPRVYSAVVEAGLRSGNLPRALEALSTFAQMGKELRQRIEFAFIYPLFIFLISYVLFLTFVVQAAPHWQEIWGEIAPQGDIYVTFLAGLHQSWQLWVWIPPAVVIGIAAWWTLVARQSFLPDRRQSQMLHFIPGLASVVVDWHWANFCELLATLLEHQVPLPTAISLAGDATGNQMIRSEMASVSAQLVTGKSIADGVRNRRNIPGYLRWSLGTAQDPQAFQSALRHGRDVFRSRATFRADMIKMWLPLVVILVVGGGAALIYTLSLALPLRALYWQLNLDSMR